MQLTLWYLIVGALLIFMALASSLLKRLPISSATLYLFVGLALGPAGVGLIRFDPVEESATLRVVAEIAVIISLFSAGLKLRAPLSDAGWRLSLRLALGSMLLTVLMLTVSGVFLLGLSLGAAVLVAAILAPTDPVLASDVQVENAGDRDRLRFGLTGEAGLNDGVAFPFVMLGLGLLGAHELGTNGTRWLGVDVAWAAVAGIGIGGLLGSVVGRLVIHLRGVHRKAVGLDEFLALGLIALSYGAALSVDGNGFLAVFAAGLALRRIEHRSSGERPPESVVGETRAGKEHETATDPEKAPAYLMHSLLGFTEQTERLGEVHVVLLIGGMLSFGYWSAEAIVIVPLLFLVIRPIAVGLGLAGAGVARFERRLVAWFGVRGIGSFYLLMVAIEGGLPDDLARRLTALVLTVVAASILVHGISATPLMAVYQRYRQRRRGRHRRGGDGTNHAENELRRASRADRA